MFCCWSRDTKLNRSISLRRGRMLSGRSERLPSGRQLHQRLGLIPLRMSVRSARSVVRSTAASRSRMSCLSGSVLQCARHMRLRCGPAAGVHVHWQLLRRPMRDRRRSAGRCDWGIRDGGHNYCADIGVSGDVEPAVASRAEECNGWWQSGFRVYGRWGTGENAGRWADTVPGDARGSDALGANCRRDGAIESLRGK